MEILSINSVKLQNEEHFKFQTDFRGLVESFTPATLGIETLYPAYLPFYFNESEAIDVIRKNLVTNDLAIADTLRDRTYRGLVGTVKSATNHFKPEIRASAERLVVVFDTYGNIAIKPYEKETVAIDELVIDLQETYAADIATSGLTEWVAALKAQNTAFDNLMKTKHTENSSKTSYKMKIERCNVDEKYHAIVKRINALIEVNGSEAYGAFVAELNSRITACNNTIAQREGRNAKAATTDNTNNINE